MADDWMTDERPAGSLTWTQTTPDLWRSTCGRYTIVRTWLPETPPREAFTLRRIDPAMARVRPDTVGYFRAEHYALSGAQQAAERDAYTVEHAADTHVPEDFPAVALARFYWPISDGTTRAALAVVAEDDRLLARVVGMARKTDPYEPVTYAEIDLDEVLAAVKELPDVPWK